MAKVSMVNRQIKREKLVQKFAKKREELKKISRDSSLTNEERFKARLALAKLPRNSSPTRLHNRCAITGRPCLLYTSPSPRDNRTSRMPSSA